jgi:orotidine-5'-phosphate decarboxylase
VDASGRGAAEPAAGGSRFRAKYELAAARSGSLLCVGLDPDPALLPPGVDRATFLRTIIEATADLVCCFKPNAAFFEVDGAAGWEELRATIAAAPADVPVLLDAKRGDVGHSASFYARAVFETLGADAVTVSPYLGGDAVEPFLAHADRHSFVVCRTSNPGAGELQDLVVEGRPLYERVAERANAWNARGNVGLVVGATYPEQAARVRALCPELLLLLPGVGAQQGDLGAAVAAARDARGGGLLVNASRGVLYASRGADYAQAARAAARELRDAIAMALRG